jgi:transposase
MDKYSTRDFDRDFPNDDACLEWLFNQRWPDGVFCNKCQRTTGHYRLNNRPVYSCEFCGSHVYPMAGTIFEGTRFSHLRLWFKAIAYMAVTRCGISSRQLSRDLGVTVKTGWRMFTQIRKILSENGDGSPLTGIVEVDETYVGGHRPGKRGRGAEGKTIVMGMVERNGRVRARIIPDVKARTLLPAIDATVSKDAVVHTDDLASYRGLGKMGYAQFTVAHSEKVYVTGDGIHTNSIEGFWSQLKRSIDGTYHHVSARHLQGYVDEYSFRYSHRNDQQAMFLTMLGRVVGVVA